jgi:quercetin dioxygenase-like cupin family protein
MGHTEKRGVEKLKPLPAKLVDLLDYQEGSVVSRSIVHKETGSVTLFAFDEGQKWGEHLGLFDSLFYLLEGEAEIVISGKAFHVKEGELVIVPANQAHETKALKKTKMTLTMIR